MSHMNLPLEIYDVLERKYGRDDAMATAKVIETTLSNMEERSRELATQRKLEVKEELKVELRDELATKADIAHLEGATKADIARLEGATKADIAHLEGATKADIARLEGATKADIAKVYTAIELLDKKSTVLWLITIFTVIFLNQNALEFLAKLLGLIR